MSVLTYKDFERKLEEGNLVPIWEEVLADYETPVSVFRKIDSSDYSFLLESVEGGEKWARYSFLGSDPSVIFRSKGDRIQIFRDGSLKEFNGDPIDALRELLGKYRPVVDKSLPRFHGGGVGYFSYDIVRFIEKLPEIGVDELGLWDAIYIITDTVIVFDNVNHKMKVVANAFVEEGADPRTVYDKAVQKINGLKDRLSKPINDNYLNSGERVVDNGECKPESNFEVQKFKDAVKKTKEYIRAGDIIQAVISQRWKTELKVDSFDLYRALRVLNPSPYMFYLKMDDHILVGSSPEVMVRVEDGRIENRPIAGTRPRGKNIDEDKKFEDELLADPKERAEHVMLVDLARNDLGRIARVGTVKVDEFMVVEKYSHVMHIVSNVIARLRDDKDAFDVLKATFPAGTLSGAPKIRAMEIIEETEPSRRGAYGGAIGYFGFTGNMDSCITIRTFVIKDKQIYIQAGAGIVADSDADNEYQETVNKVKALVKAVELVQSGELK